MIKPVIPFSTEQVEFLKTYYNIDPLKDAVQVSDGFVHNTSNVWVRSNDGPMHVSCSRNWEHIKANPEKYSINKPNFTVTYHD